jgi:hypothetical protein
VGRRARGCGLRAVCDHPKRSARYRELHAPSGAKSDPGDAHVLAELVRLDRAHHRPVTGVVDIVRFLHRPSIRVEFFESETGQPTRDESAIALTRRVMREVRAQAPPALPGRAKKRAHFQRRIEESAADEKRARDT